MAYPRQPRGARRATLWRSRSCCGPAGTGCFRPASDANPAKYNCQDAPRVDAGVAPETDSAREARLCHQSKGSQCSLSRPCGDPLSSKCFSPVRYLLGPLRLLPAGATVAGRVSHSLGHSAFPRRTKNQGYHLEPQFRPRRPAPVRGVLYAQSARLFHAPDLPNWLMACISGCAPSSVPAARSGTRYAPPSRLFLFTSWDQVLERMNSPPQPLPPYRAR